MQQNGKIPKTFSKEYSSHVFLFSQHGKAFKLMLSVKDQQGGRNSETALALDLFLHDTEQHNKQANSLAILSRVFVSCHFPFTTWKGFQTDV